MQCPVDHTLLEVTSRQGVEIDYCPTCRGVWLDRGELDKLIDREAEYTAPRREERPRQEYREQPRERRYDDDDDHRGHHDQKRHHKKESFLGDLFDF